MYRKYSSCCGRRGLTLIEVVTALAILSTLLIGTLVAFKKNAERLRAQISVRDAVSGVDRLLLAWAAQGTYPPERARGTLPGDDRFAWRTRLVSRELRQALMLDIVRLEVSATDARGSSAPLLAIDLPVPARAARPEGGPRE